MSDLRGEQAPPSQRAKILDARGQHDLPLLGIGLFLVNLILMAILGAMVRKLSYTYPLAEILLIRYFAAFLLFVLVLRLGSEGWASLKTLRPLDHAVRSIAGFVSLALLYFAYTKIPLADATALAYSSPLFIALLSIVILGERIGLRRWAAIICGFIGVLLIAQPGGAAWNIGTLAATGSAFTGALVATWLRRLSESENPATTGFYYSGLGSLVCLFWVLQVGWIIPGAGDWWFLLIFGIMCGLQQWSLNVAFRFAEASAIAPFAYLAVVFAAIAGYLFWQEVPVLTTWIGSIVIAASGLFIVRRRRQVH